MSKRDKSRTESDDFGFEFKFGIDNQADDAEVDDAVDDALHEAAADDGPLVDDDAMAGLERERDELIDQVRRVTADYHNYIKRSDNQREQAMRFARGDLLAKFIPVLDHFDNALTQRAESQDAKALAQGLHIVRDELLKVLQQEGVARLEPEVGEAFNPEMHEALIRQPAEGVPANHITASLQPGYTYGDRTLRAAKVAVAPGD